MQLKITIPFIITFLLLLLVMMELHELVHISVGRVLCGYWGTRDFNAWSLYHGCQDSQPHWWLATLAGPLFSFSMMWIGQSLLSSKEAPIRLMGLLLVFANIPFGRVTTVMLGGGDEMVVVRHFLQTGFSHTTMVVAGSLLVTVVTLPPVIKAGKAIGNKNSWLFVAGFLTLPLLFLLTYLLTGLNGLLSAGLLAQPWIMGTPLLISVHTILITVALVVFRRHLISLE